MRPRRAPDPVPRWLLPRLLQLTFTRAWRNAALAAALTAALVTALAGAAPLSAAPAALNQRVAEARRVAPALGVHVVDVASGEEVYAYNADRPRVLASNTKLLTTAAALDLLPTDFAFETPLLIRGTVYAGELDGDLAVLGSGDPTISGRFHDEDIFAVFRRWAALLADRGVRRIKGDLLLVHGLFDGQLVHPDWPDDQLDRWYEAPVAALSFNDNCVLVRVSPGFAAGAPPRVEIEPDLGLLGVRVDAVTTASRRRHKVAVARSPGSSVIRVSGAVWEQARPVESWVSVPDPLAYFAAALRQVFAEQGVRIDGETRQPAVLPGAVWEQVAVHRSALDATLEVINHNSQNFFAESLLKRLAAENGGRPGSFGRGVAVVESFLDRLGVAGPGLELADGSGMSRNNRATPRQVTSLLTAMAAHPRALAFLDSLPTSGKQKTSWEKRLAEAPYEGRVLAKTGTLRGVSTLSGYVKSRSGRLYAFSILCNETPAVWRARRAQDGILKALIDQG